MPISLEEALERVEGRLEGVKRKLSEINGVGGSGEPNQSPGSGLRQNRPAGALNDGNRERDDLLEFMRRTPQIRGLTPEGGGVLNKAEGKAIEATAGATIRTANAVERIARSLEGGPRLPTELMD